MPNQILYDIWILSEDLSDYVAPHILPLYLMGQFVARCQQEEKQHNRDDED